MGGAAFVGRPDLALRECIPLTLWIRYFGATRNYAG